MVDDNSQRYQIEFQGAFMQDLGREFQFFFVAFNSCKGWYENMNSTESNLEVDTFDVDFIAQTTTVSSFPSTGSTIAHYPTDSEFVHLSTGGDPDSCYISGCNDPRHVSANTYNALLEGGFLTKGFVSKEDFEEALCTQVHNVTSLDELDNDMAIARQRFWSFVKSSQNLLLIDPGATSTLTSDREILFNYDRNGGKSLSATGHHRIHTEGAGTIKLKTDLHDVHFEISCQFAPSIVCQDGVPFTIISTAHLPVKFMIDQTNPSDSPHLLTDKGTSLETLNPEQRTAFDTIVNMVMFHDPAAIEAQSYPRKA
ncbi:unnamed protein product [Ambrosiozyma monospora]|uniref:Unnamed protein product n=1 Tax=Ambrosiozyma monospora TaxID=43982 RepID=A0A9W6YRC8_AMBMO|nr:unnamed protein product [Ambrosiozyma monospora]